MQRRAFLLACLLLAAGTARGESFPPGDYSDVGRVVRRASGDFDLFNGHGCPVRLSEDLSARLAPHLGQMIRLDYTRVPEEEKPDAVWDMMGAPIGAIRKIAVLPPSPVTVGLAATQTSFGLGEPVRVTVTLRGLPAKAARREPIDVAVNLLRDYRRALSIRPARPTPPAPHDGPPTAAQVPLGDAKPKETPQTARPPTSMVLPLRSDHIAKPGVYDAIAMFGTSSGRPVLSRSVRITIREPKDAADETAALRAWLSRGKPYDRVLVAQRLMERGDASGVDVVIELIASRTPVYQASRAYAFLWAHGGERGEQVLQELLAEQQYIEGAHSVMQDVGMSERRVDHFRSWLSNEHEVFTDVAGTGPRPRICDLAASWLARSARPDMAFPRWGTLDERNRALAAVRAQLESDPTRFTVLAREP